MTRLKCLPFFVALAVVSCPLLAWPQKERKRPFMNAQITVQVRYKSGSAAQQGMMVTLEGEQGGITAQDQTDSVGKVVFRPTQPGVYVVTVSEPGYREAKYRVDLTLTQTSFVTVELQPLAKADLPAVPPEGPGAKISVQQSSVPPAAMQELEKGRKLLLDSKQPEKSISHFRRAIELYPSDATAYLLMGTAYMDLHKWKDAESTLAKAIELNDKMSAAHLALGTCLNMQGNFTAAEKSLVRGLELDPETADGHYELGKAYWALGRWQEAEPHARKALQLQPDFPAAHVLMGNVLLRKRDAPAALQEFKEYLRLDPNGPFAPPTRQMVAKIENALATRK